MVDQFIFYNRFWYSERLVLPFNHSSTTLCRIPNRNDIAYFVIILCVLSMSFSSFLSSFCLSSYLNFLLNLSAFFCNWLIHTIYNVTISEYKHIPLKFSFTSYPFFPCFFIIATAFLMDTKRTSICLYVFILYLMFFLFLYYHIFIIGSTFIECFMEFLLKIHVQFLYDFLMVLLSYFHKCSKNRSTMFLSLLLHLEFLPLEARHS